MGPWESPSRSAFLQGEFPYYQIESPSEETRTAGAFLVIHSPTLAITTQR